MKVIVRQIECQTDQCRAECHTEFGTIWATWQGEPPRLGDAYHVEIDLPAVAIMNVRFAEASDRNPSLHMGVDSSVILVGTLQHDHVGGTSLQLGDTVVLLDSPLELASSGSVIQCTAFEVLLFPVSL